MEHDNEIAPDAIIILSAGTIEYNVAGEKRRRSTSYEECDSFGTLGGYSRMRAGSILADIYPTACIVAMDRLAMPAELIERGVPASRVLALEGAPNTATEIERIGTLAKERGWQKIVLVSSEYHIPRVRALFNRARFVDCTVDFIAAEPIIIDTDPTFEAEFSAVRETDSYRKRLESERRGIEALVSGTYSSAPREEKIER